MEISSKAKKSINILSPYLGQNAHHLLSENIKKLDVKLVVDFGDSSVKLGSTSPNEVEVFKKIGEVKTNENLHSKLYIFDKKCVLLTSANLTQNGFTSNLEVGMEINDNKTLSKCQKYFDRVWRQSEEITYGRIADAKKMYKPKYGAKPSSKRTSRKWESEPKKERFWKFGVTNETKRGFKVVWGDCKKRGLIRIGWGYCGDLSKKPFHNKKGEELRKIISKRLGEERGYQYNNKNSKPYQLATFRDSIRIGDYVVAYNHGKIVGVGRVEGTYNYDTKLVFDDGEVKFQHARRVKWNKSVGIEEIEKGKSVKKIKNKDPLYKILAKQPTIVEIKEKDNEKFFELL